MLPIIDYGGIALVIPNVSAVGNVFENEGNFGFEVYLVGTNEPIVVGFPSSEEAVESRDELIAVIAQYYYIKEFGPDFDLDDLADAFEDEDDAEDIDDDSDDSGSTERH